MNYLNSRKETVSDFEKYNNDELIQLEKDIEKITNLYIFILTENPKYCVKEKNEYFILILRSIEYLITATYLAKQRAISETGNIIRLCIETSSMAAHIHSDLEVFKKYKQGNYKSTSAISFIKKHINVIGEFWGDISNVYVHPNTYHGILSELIEDSIVEKGQVNLGFKHRDKFKDKQILLLLRISANIILKCFELIVTKKVKINNNEVLFLEGINKIMFAKDTCETINELFEELNK